MRAPESSRSGRRRRLSQGESDNLSELEVLQAVSRAFGSSADLNEASTSAVRWVRAAVGSTTAAVRLFLVDPEGNLAPVNPRMEITEDPRRRFAREQILRRFLPERVELPDGRTLATLPLMSRGEAVGVLEVTGPSELVQDRWDTLEAVASHVAIVLRNLIHRSRLSSSYEALRRMSEQAGEMVRARAPQDAVRIAVRFCSEHFRLPTAGWLAAEDPARLELVAYRGFSSGSGDRLRAGMRTLSVRAVRTDEGIIRAEDRFAQSAGRPMAHAVLAGSALLMVGGPARSDPALEVIRELLEEVVGHLTVVEAAERRTERLDLGLALTAHEVRGPLVGALAIIERLLMNREDDEEGHLLLRRSREQLQDLAELVDGLLRWAVAENPLQLQPTDLTAVIRDAVKAAAEERGEERRVRLTGIKPITVLADPDNLRIAISNVIRNALAYSPATTQVTVAVGAAHGTATVAVRDRGPGVPASERDSIFDPFMRGSTGHLARTGNGLGLFISRRVMEAHGGRIWLSSNGTGSVFHLELPLAGAR